MFHKTGKEEKTRSENIFYLVLVRRVTARQILIRILKYM